MLRLGALTTSVSEHVGLTQTLAYLAGTCRSLAARTPDLHARLLRNID